MQAVVSPFTPILGFADPLSLFLLLLQMLF